MGAIRDNWRVITLTILLVLSGVALFGPSGAASGGAEADTGPTNLKYGIELSGGARIRAPIAGFTAELQNGSIGVNGTDAIENTVRKELGVDAINIAVSRGQRSAEGNPTVEVFANPISPDDFESQAAFRRAENASANVSESEFRRALQAAGVQPQTIRLGVTQETRDTMTEVLTDKINAAGLSGGSVRIAESPGTAFNFVVVEAPNRNVQELKELISQRGTVEVVAYYPKNGNYTNETVLTQEMNFEVGPPSYNERSGNHFVPITFQNQSDARQFANELTELGFGSGSNCPSPYRSARPPMRCLLTVFDGEVVYSAGVNPSLGQSWADGSFLNNPEFIMQTTSAEQARELQISLKAGRLPASLDFDRGTQFSLEPALAQRFKINSLITGIVAVLAVALVVYFRYGDGRVAAPMVITAMSEVVLLLGFAAAVSYPLDLSVIAGFIAVIGTGVDDLIIIADEVMSEGEVNSSRVFQSRFRKAFWVIGAAAATTILAMSPLAVLSLGDLQGFAIVTILGVLIGVLITRPAYGDILRKLLTER